MNTMSLRLSHAQRGSQKQYLTLAKARENRFNIDWNSDMCVKPKFVGTKTYRDYPLAEIRKYIDWTPFFQTWMLKGKYPDIFDDQHVGNEATKLYEDANQMLDEVIADGTLSSGAVIGVFPANSNGDDVLVYEDDNRAAKLCTVHFLRQQGKKS